MGSKKRCYCGRALFVGLAMAAALALVAGCASAPAATPAATPAAKPAAATAAPVATAETKAPAAPASAAQKAPSVPEKIGGKIKIGYLPVNVMTPMYAAYAKTWEKEGLDVEPVLLRGGPAIVEAMQSGSIQAGDIGYMPALFAASKGLPFLMLASDGIMAPGYPAHAVIVANDSPVKSFKDLKGKTIAINQKGTVEYVSLAYAVGKFGMKFDDLQILTIPYVNQGAAVKLRQVDAALPYPPHVESALIKGEARVLVEANDFMPYSEISGLAVRKDWADANPEAAKRLAKGYIAAGRWVNQNPQEARKAAKQTMGLGDDLTAGMRMPYWPENGYHLMPSVWDLYGAMIQTDLIKPVQNPQKMMDDFFIQGTLKYTVPAVKELGEKPDPVWDKIKNIKLPYLDKDPAVYYGPWQR